MNLLLWWQPTTYFSTLEVVLNSNNSLSRTSPGKLPFLLTKSSNKCVAHAAHQTTVSTATSHEKPLARIPQVKMEPIPHHIDEISKWLIPLLHLNNSTPSIIWHQRDCFFCKTNNNGHKKKAPPDASTLPEAVIVILLQEGKTTSNKKRAVVVEIREQLRLPQGGLIKQRVRDTDAEYLAGKEASIRIKLCKLRPAWLILEMLDNLLSQGNNGQTLFRKICLIDWWQLMTENII
jgi:hypothetical protein